MKSMRISLSAAVMVIFLAGGCGSEGAEDVYTGIVEGKIYAISSPIHEKLVSLSVTEGDYLSAGEMVGQIDTRALELQQKGLVSKQAQLLLQLEELAIQTSQVKDTKEHFSDTYIRNLELLEAEAVSDQTVQDLKLNVDKWERELEGLLLKRQILIRQKEEIGYRIEEMALMIEKGILASPVEGYVDNVYYSEGEYVPALRPVAQVVSLAHVWCYIYVHESTITALTPGMELKAVSLGRDLAARIEHINSQAEFTPKEVLTPDNRSALVYGVRIGIENPDGILKIGMPVDIYLGK